MQNINFDNEMKKLSSYVYKNNNNQVLKNYIKIAEKVNKNTGFYSAAFYNNNKVIIAYRGSDDINDWVKNNLNMGTSNLPAQYMDAQDFYDEIKEDFPNQKIVFTGHSLGGSIAQLMSLEEWEKNEKAIMRQLKEKGIPTEKELENTKSKNYQNEDGHWVTINGTHVFIED